MSSACCSSTPEISVTDPATAKFHTALNVTDLARSTAFYSLLFGCEPAKQRRDYVKFELSVPPLVLSLIPGRPAPGGILNHFGLRLPDAEALVETQRRLETGGIRTTREEGVECCYARQTKFWVADPDQVLWEIYVFHEDIEEHGDGEVPAADQLPAAGTGLPDSSRIIWRHQIREPFPEELPEADCSVHEALLEGSANKASAGTQLSGLLREVFRVLRPGGEIRLHGLTGDAPLRARLPSLPGPAAVVEAVPSHQEIADALASASFVQVRLETLSARAHFTVEGVALRESLICGRKPGHRSKAQPRFAIYLGPLAQVTDDLGNTFRRGEPLALNQHDWQILSQSTLAEAFLLG